MIFLEEDTVLTSRQLAGFRDYKYSSIDTNPIGTYIMHPFWNWLIRFIPRWLAPNLITFIGFIFIIVAFVLLSIFDYNFYASSDDKPGVAPIPRWIFMAVAYCIFISYTLDGIDGKQARRTNTSGPLGELFDHGLDSWTTVFIPVLLYSLFGRLDYSLPPTRLYYICWSVFVNFYLSHVEKYNTGILYLPWSYDFSMLGCVFMFSITFVFGHTFWKRHFFGTISCGQLLEIVFYASSIIFNVPMIFRCRSAYKNGTARMTTLYEALRPLIPFLMLFVLSLFWLNYSPTNLINRDPRMFCLTTGNIFSNICCQLIVAQMSNTRSNLYNGMLIPFFAAVCFSIFLPALELLILYTMFAYSTVFHVSYGVYVVKKMCMFFGIECFIIPRHSSH